MTLIDTDTQLYRQAVADARNVARLTQQRANRKRLMDCDDTLSNHRLRQRWCAELYADARTAYRVFVALKVGMDDAA